MKIKQIKQQTDEEINRILDLTLERECPKTKEDERNKKYGLALCMCSRSELHLIWNWYFEWFIRFVKNCICDMLGGRKNAR